MQGEKIYTYDLNITGVTDFGISLGDITSGRTAIPPQGARFNVAFEGPVSGRIQGRVTGVDYLCLRADGRFDLDIRAVIETADGCRIALSATGAAVPRPGGPIAELAENVTLTTTAPAYAWVNARQIWGPGTVNLATGAIHVDGYMQ